MPLLNSQVTDVEIVDLSDLQLDYIRLKYELIKALDLEDYLKFMGYSKGSVESRKALLSRITLSEQARNFALQIPDALMHKGLIYSGRWESFLIRLGKLIRTLCAKDFGVFFEERSLQSQHELFIADWPELRLRILMRLFANQRLLNHFLYKGEMAQASGPNLLEFLEENFRHAFTTDRARKSFFHQILFLGEVAYPEARPLEVQPDSFTSIKKFQGQLHFKKLDLMQALETSEATAFSFSDVISYFSPMQIQRLSKALDEKLGQGAKIAVLRSFLNHPQLSLSESSFRNKNLESLATRQDSTLLYQFQVYSSL